MSEKMKFRERPTVIEAIQWTGKESLEDVKSFLGDAFFCWHMHSDTISIKMPEGFMGAPLGNWITRNVAGELCVYEPTIFEQTYEEVNELKEEMLRITTPCIDGEWHGDGYPSMASVLVDQLLPLMFTELTPREKKPQSDE